VPNRGRVLKKRQKEKLRKSQPKGPGPLEGAVVGKGPEKGSGGGRVLDRKKEGMKTAKKLDRHELFPLGNGWEKYENKTRPRKRWQKGNVGLQRPQERKKEVLIANGARKSHANG